MDEDEAKRMLAEHLASYRGLGYEALAARVDTIETAEARSRSGVSYQLEVQFLWDSTPGENVRVIGSIDDGGLRSSFRPLTEDFIMEPDGGFVDEHDRRKVRTMYGLIGKMTAKPGKRGELVEILLEGVAGMPGCLSYVVAKDRSDPDALWVTEVWKDEASHAASLELPSVREAIARGRPMIEGFGPERFETEPVGGHGLVEPDA